MGILPTDTVPYDSKCFMEERYDRASLAHSQTIYQTIFTTYLEYEKINAIYNIYYW